MTATTSKEAQAELSARLRRATELADLPLEPAGPTSGFISGTAQSVRDIWRYRSLLNLLFRRELKARYKDSTLGLVWSLLRPLALLAVYTVAIGKFLGASKGGQDYPIYVFCGLTIWQLFSEIVSSGTGSILANGGLVKKIYLPREVFPLSTVGSALFNFMMQVVILVVFTFIVGRPPTGMRLLYALLAVAIILVWATAFGFVLGALNVYLRDIQYLVEIGLMFGMWTAPVVYFWDKVHASLHTGWAEQIYLANPITVSVLGFQRAFWVTGDAFPQETISGLGVHMVGMLLVGLVLLWLCQRVFSRLQNNFAQEL